MVKENEKRIKNQIKWSGVGHVRRGGLLGHARIPKFSPHVCAKFEGLRPTRTYTQEGIEVATPIASQLHSLIDTPTCEIRSESTNAMTQTLTSPSLVLNRMLSIERCQRKLISTCHRHRHPVDSALVHREGGSYLFVSQREIYLSSSVHVKKQ